MEKQIKILENGAVQIDEVVITDRALFTLRFFQEYENESLNNRIAELAEAVCMLAIATESCIGEHKMPLFNAMINLSYIRDNLKYLAGPAKKEN